MAASSVQTSVSTLISHRATRYALPTLSKSDIAACFNIYLYYADNEQSSKITEVNLNLPLECSACIDNVNNDSDVT